MIRPSLLCAATLIAATSLAGCKSDQECRRARLAGVSAWEDVKNQSGKLKLSGGPGYEALTESQKKDHFDTWNKLEEGSGLIFESFAFERIGWMGAQNGRKQVQAAYKDVDRDKFASFSASLDAALKRFSEVEAACR